MAQKRTRVHSRDIQPVIIAPKAMFAAARVQRFDIPLNMPSTNIDELGRVLHVGTSAEIPTATVTMEAFDVSHNTFSYMTGYTPGTFPVSGASVTELKNIDVIGQLRDPNTKYDLQAIYVKRGIVSGMDATFGVRADSTVSYTVTSNSKKELEHPVYADYATLGSGTSAFTLSHTPRWLPRTSGYTLDAYRTGTDGTTGFLDETTDYTVAGSVVTFNGNSTATGDSVWVSYSSAVSTQAFEGVDDVAAAAIQGKYVPVTISAANIKRVQAATVRVAFNSEQILEMGGMGAVVGYENGVPDVTGDITVLKTDNDIINLLTGQGANSDEVDMNFAVTNLPLKIQLHDPRNISKIVLTYYIPSITITSESDTDQVNQSMNEVFGYKSTTGELIIASGAGPW